MFKEGTKEERPIGRNKQNQLGQAGGKRSPHNVHNIYTAPKAPENSKTFHLSLGLKVSNR